MFLKFNEYTFFFPLKSNIDILVPEMKFMNKNSEMLKGRRWKNKQQWKIKRGENE